MIGLYAGFVEPRSARVRLQSRRPASAALRPPRILLVEDDPTIRQMTQFTLERDGFVVATAPDSAGDLAAPTERSRPTSSCST